MQHLNVERQPRNCVMAIFETSVVSFELPPAATLKDIAVRVGEFRRKQDGTLIRVDVRVQS
jgi:hypothetical protein